MTIDETTSIDVHRTYSLFVGGRLPQALEAFDRIVRNSGGDPLQGRELTNFSPLVWAEFMGAWALAQSGRFGEYWPRLDRSIRMARDYNEREMLSFALGATIQCAYFARGTSCAPVTDLRRVGSESVELAEAVGSLYAQIYTLSHFATSCFLSGDHAACEEHFTDMLTRARSSGTALEAQGHALAVFADSCLARGDVGAAIAKAREGIAVSDSGGMWFQSATARIVLAEALIQSGGLEADAKSVIAQAREFVRKSGGNSLLPRLREAEARLAGRTDRAALIAGLREAEAMWRSMGAPDPADRLAKELASVN